MRTEKRDMYCLIVDDNPDCRWIARKVVEQMGFKTRIAGSGREAVAITRESLPGAVLLDWNLLDMNGLAFIDELQRIPSGRTVPVIMCTGEAAQEKVQTALASGARGYLIKPFSEQDVVKQFGLLRIRPTTTVLGRPLGATPPEAL
jgi:two-component system chemotaxis response regulator CheY